VSNQDFACVNESNDGFKTLCKTPVDKRRVSHLALIGFFVTLFDEWHCYKYNTREFQRLEF